MNTPTTRRNAPFIMFALAGILALPIISLAQGRGNGNGRGGGPNLDKKCAKFVNCHDARDGRLDGRGPAINPASNPAVIQIPQQPNVGIYRRDRDRDNQGSYPRSRNRRVNRSNEPDGSRDDNWRRRRRDNSDPTETRDRRTHRHNRNNVID